MQNTKLTNCQNCKQAFTIEPEDFQFYEKIQVPAPTFCPECRLIRRLAWRNERALYQRKCEQCGKQIISIYSPEKDIQVYCPPCWWKDDWDGIQYGVDFDSSKFFLVQLRELFQRVPQMSLFGIWSTIVNSPYVNAAAYVKDCYFLTQSDHDENCLYGGFITHSKDSVDNLFITNSELCYENVNCQRCYRTFYSVDCDNCYNGYFLRNCIECTDCFGCVNLRNKQFYLFNKSYSKEMYEKKVKEYRAHSFKEREKLKESVYKFWAAFPTKYAHERHNQNVTGDYIYNSKNVFHSFLMREAEDCRFCALAIMGGTKDSYDFTHYGPKSELLYESLQTGESSRISFGWFVVNNSSNVEYSMFIIGGNNIFGCAGLKNRKYCILNKQYSKGEYEKLRKRIIEQMNANPYLDKKGSEYRYGEFFPIEMSPFGYNETTAQELFPLISEQASEQGYQWKESGKEAMKTTMTHDRMPDAIHDVPDSIFAEIIACQHQGKCNEQCSVAFRIISAELQYYRKMNIPLPRLCPNCRHYQRLKFRNPMKLWQRTCACAGITSDNGVYKNTVEHSHKSEHCPNTFQTSYAPDRPEIVYCEQCYVAEVA